MGLLEYYAAQKKKTYFYIAIFTIFLSSNIELFYIVRKPAFRAFFWLQPEISSFIGLDTVKKRVAKGLNLFLQKLKKKDCYNFIFAKTSLFAYVPLNLQYFVIRPF